MGSTGLPAMVATGLVFFLAAVPSGFSQQGPLKSTPSQQQQGEMHMRQAQDFLRAWQAA